MQERSKKTIIEVKNMINRINEILNTEIAETDYMYDVDRNKMRELRNQNIKTAQIILDMEMRGLI